LATDIYRPAFPAMTDNLSTSSAAVQLSLTAFLIGAGVGQVIFGPVSDRTGRVPPLVAGLAVYVAASAGAALAPTAGVLIGARLIQGLSGAAGMVIGRAVISDLAEGAQAARAFSAMMLVSGVAPVVGPLAGSTLAGSVGWRGLLWIVAVLGAISLAAVVLVVRESHRAARRPAAAGHRDSMRALLSPAYAGSALAYGFGFATMMAYISASPFVYQELIGLSAVEYGIMFGLNALGLMAVSGLSARLAHRYQARSLAWAGLLINLGAVAVLCVLACLNIHSILLAARYSSRLDPLASSLETPQPWRSPPCQVPAAPVPRSSGSSSSDSPA
jgi:DHA1 family bicyclomycin/chloramphenicol resistance-like MFS transporter